MFRTTMVQSVARRESGYSLAVTGLGTQMATASQDGTARVWDIQTGKQVAILSQPDESVWAIALSRQGDLLATGNGSGIIRIYHLDQKRSRNR